MNKKDKEKLYSDKVVMSQVEVTPTKEKELMITNNVVSQLDFLKYTVDTELTLRNAANMEFNNGQHNGPMNSAHSQSILNVIAAAKQLIIKAGI